MVKVLHIKSNVVTDNKPKLPTKEQIEYGEIAVNYAADHETISLRNSRDEIKAFSSDEYYTKQKLGTAFTDSTVTDVLNNELKTKLNVADFNSYTGNVSNNEQVIAGGISELKNEISGKQDKGNYALKGDSYTKAESDTKYLAKTIYDAEKKNFATKEDIKGLSSSTAQTSYDDSQIKADIKALQDGKLDTTTYDSDKTTMNSKIDSKADKTTTYTKTDVDNLLNKKVNISDYKPLTAGTGIKIENNTISTTLDTTIFRFADALPTENIEQNKLYFVPSTTKGEHNIYTEYAYHDNAWEILGQYKADVDLTLYAKTTDVDTKLADSEQVIAGGISELKNKVDAATATTYTKTDVDNKLAAKLDTSAYTKVNTSDFATAANTYTKAEVDDKIPTLPKFRTINGNAITGDTTDITIQGGTSSTSYDDTKIKADIKSLQDSKLDKTDYTPYNDSEIRQEISTKQDKGDYALKGDSYTKAESDGKYLTEHQDISGKLDKNSYDNDKTTFATKTEVTNKLADYAKTSDVTAALSKKQDVLTIDDKLDKTSTNAVQNKAIATELENLMKAISGVLNDINERLNTLSNTVAKQIKNSTE